MEASEDEEEAIADDSLMRAGFMLVREGRERGDLMLEGLLLSK